MNLESIRRGLKEVKFIRSFNDLKIFYTQKLPFFLARFSGDPSREIGVPLSVQIEPTNYCNLSCVFCSTSKSPRKKNYMDFALFEKIVADASDIGVKRIHLYLHGEPMLHKQIVKMIRHIKQKGLGVTITSNGMLFDKKTIKEILQSGVNSSDYIVFSINGYSKEVHEQVMRGVKHEKVMENIANFTKLRSQLKVNGPILEAVFFRSSENEHEEELFKREMQTVVDYVHPIVGISQQFASRGAGSSFVRNKTCKNLWERMTVYWNGDVTMCFSDLDGNYVLGNLKEKGIKEIWNSDKLLSIRELHKKGLFKDIVLCAKCDLKSV